MVRFFTRKHIAVLCVTALLAGTLLTYFMVNKPVLQPVSLAEHEQTTAEGVIDYNRYLQENVNRLLGEGTYTLPFGDGVGYAKLKAGQKLEGEVTVQKAGLYRLKLAYAPIGNSLYDYDVTILVNGKLPYAELKNMPVKSVWEINSARLSKGFSPDLVKTTGKLTQKLYDRGNYYDQPLQLYLPAGVNRLTLEAGALDIGIYALILYTEKDVPDYQAYQATLSQAKGKPVFIQGEYADYRNNPSILELKDCTSPATIPASVDKKTVNTIGGKTFKKAADTLTWKFIVEKAGTYSFKMRVRQDFSSGSVAFRTLLIDDELPFKECKTLPFPYQSGFRIVSPADDKGNTYCFELSPGPHTLTLAVTLGDNALVIREMSQIQENLNTIYRRIIMLTSPDPDPYRDYLIEDKLPDVLALMREQAERLRNVSDYLAFTSRARGTDNAVLDKMVKQLDLFSEKPEYIPSLLTDFNSNKSAIGTWIMNKTNQPLEIDWMEFVPMGEKGTYSNENLFSRMGFGFRQFLSSFTTDYSGNTDTQKTVDVWTTAGRDQVEVIRRLVDEKFTPQYKLGINLKLVQANTLLPAVVSGIGPDVSIMNANSNAVNFAVRKAVTDVSKLPGYTEIASEFDESALLPLRLQNGVYGLPEQQSFPLLFYRKDIFDELKLPLPETWDDAYNLMFDLQKNNMSFAVPLGMPSYAMFLYQNGGQLYTPDGSACLMDNETGITAFKQWTRYFSDFDLSRNYNFVNRFRSGEMPIGVADYTTYNTLVVFAPEIYDLWDIASVPGVRKADGTIDRSVASTGTCSMLFNASKVQNEAWQFLKWWNGSETQRDYAREIEIKLGSSARYPAANRVAFDKLMWTPHQLDVLKEQMQSVKGIPEVPGGYFTTRHLDFAFRQVVIHKREVRETLMEHCEFINVEITEKRNELKLGKGK